MGDRTIRRHSIRRVQFVALQLVVVRFSLVQIKEGREVLINFVFVLEN